MLINHRELPETVPQSELEAAARDLDLVDSDLDPDPGVDRDEVKYKRERGFYDVGMLSTDVMTLSNETLKRMLSDSDDVNYLLHPDVKIEVLMAEQRKHMRIAQLLKLSQPPAEPPHPLQIIRPPCEETGGAGEGKAIPVPPNTPRLAKLKPDHCWIKDIPDSPDDVIPSYQSGAAADKAPLPLVPDDKETRETAGADVTSMDVSPQSVQPEEQVSSANEGPGRDSGDLELAMEVESPTVDSREALAEQTAQKVVQSALNAVAQMTSSVHHDGDDVTSHEEMSMVSDSVSESGSDVSRNDQAVAQHYTKEDIPWHPGKFRRFAGAVTLSR